MKDEVGIFAPRKEVSDCLREDFSMSYRKLKKVSFHGNSERCKVTRMLYAKKMLTLFQ